MFYFSPRVCAEAVSGVEASTGMKRSCEYEPGASFRSVTRLAKFPRVSVTRSTVTGVDSGNFFQPASSGPALALALNHTACAVTYTCVYSAGLLPVADRLVRVEQPASAAVSAASDRASRAVRERLMEVPACAP